MNYRENLFSLLLLWITQTVIQTRLRRLLSYTENGDILQLSDAHGLQTKRGLIPSGDLCFEDELLTAAISSPFIWH